MYANSRHNGSVLDQNHVELGVSNNSSLVLLDHSGQNTESRAWAVIGVQDTTRALVPRADWSIDGLLHFSTIEVYARAFWEVAK